MIFSTYLSSFFLSIYISTLDLILIHSYDDVTNLLLYLFHSPILAFGFNFPGVLSFPVHSIPYLVSGLSSHHSLTLLSTEQIRSLVGRFCNIFSWGLNKWWVFKGHGDAFTRLEIFFLYIIGFFNSKWIDLHFSYRSFL